jgi:DNA-binding MarR family transcriptional regulator
MTARLPSFERSLGFIISDISRLSRKAFERRVRQYGLTRSQWQLLYHLARTPGVSQSELCELLQVEKITVSRQAARLARTGWLERRDHASDGRAYCLHLTPKAVRVITRLSAASEEFRSDVMSALPPSRRKALIDDLLCIKTTLLKMEASSRNGSHEN